MTGRAVIELTLLGLGWSGWAMIAYWFVATHVLRRDLEDQLDDALDALNHVDHLTDYLPDPAVVALREMAAGVIDQHGTPSMTRGVA